MAERQGVEIDYCPQCRGVWLDRGELDKIIERSTQLEQAPPARGRDDDYQKDRRRSDSDEYRHEEDPRYRKKKRGSFWGDLFDFGD
jgi:Zn-finger nucleic acid-binding protein